MSKRDAVLEIKFLEEMFRDQIEFRLESIFKLLNIRRSQKVEIMSFLKQLHTITDENIRLLEKKL
ncbi:MAG: hypothetical protein Q8P82_02200 [bacterium]|nr:hypothetical protein [bacterium]